MEQAYPPGGENPSWGEKKQQQQQKPPAMSQQTDQYYTSSPNSDAWQTGICGCCSDMDSCCLIGGIHQHSCCCTMYGCGYRRKLRLKYGLPEQPCNDYCTECCCCCCSLAQQTRELKSCGVDPKLGWKWEPDREAYLDSVPLVPKMQR